MKITDEQEQPKKQDLLAFPLATIVPPHGLQTQPSFYLQSGMTLRDYFAGKICANSWYVTDENGNQRVWQDIAVDAYRLADAMIKAREL